VSANAAANGTSAKDARHGVAFWTGLAIGLPIAGVGVRSFLDTFPDATQRVALAAWIAGSAVAHDAVLAPVVLTVGVLVGRFVPATVRAPVQFGFIASGVVLLLAWRPLTNSGHAARNPTVQPLDYRTATLTVIGVVWAITVAVLVLQHRRDTRRGLSAATRAR
jgi:hypothetical protein